MCLQGAGSPWPPHVRLRSGPNCLAQVAQPQLAFHAPAPRSTAFHASTCRLPNEPTRNPKAVQSVQLDWVQTPTPGCDAMAGPGQSHVHCLGFLAGSFLPHDDMHCFATLASQPWHGMLGFFCWRPSLLPPSPHTDVTVGLTATGGRMLAGILMLLPVHMSPTPCTNNTHAARTLYPINGRDFALFTHLASWYQARQDVSVVWCDDDDMHGQVDTAGTAAMGGGPGHLVQAHCFASAPLINCMGGWV